MRCSKDNPCWFSCSGINGVALDGLCLLPPARVTAFSRPYFKVMILEIERISKSLFAVIK